jgi:hypothetical protein
LIGKDLYVLALALGISGFITYKTFRWAFYQEIGPGLAALFLGFSIVVFFAINNYDFVSNYIRSAAKGRALKVMDAELQKQIEAAKLLADTVREGAENANALATEANEKGQVALETAREAKENSDEMISITALASWETLRGQFEEIEGYLRRWETANGFKREWAAPRSLPELALMLERFGKTLPEPIKRLYLERERKYELLKKLKEISASFGLPVLPAGLDLPAPPKLPAPPALSGQPVKPHQVQ